MMPETVITLQVSNLETETHGTASESTSERAAAGAQPPASAAVKLWSRRRRVLFNVESSHGPSRKSSVSAGLNNKKALLLLFSVATAAERRS